MKKGENVSYDKITEYAEGNNFSMETFGYYIVGEEFILLKSNDKDISISFILTGYIPNQGNVYECVYSDLK